MSQKVAKSEQKRSLNKSRASQSQSQAASQTQQISEEDFKALVADTVKYILHRHYENKVTKRSKLRDVIIKSKTRKFDQLMEKVGSRFDKCFGMKLVRMGESGKESFTLKNRLLEKDGSLALVNSPSEVAKEGFLALVLTYLFMMKTPVREERLYAFLRNIGILENDIMFTNDELGDVKALLTKDFVELQYLSYKDEPSSNKDPDEKIKVFQWGDRARVTIKKKDIFKFMAKIYDCSEDRWNDLFPDMEDSSSDSDDEPEEADTSIDE